MLKLNGKIKTPFCPQQQTTKKKEEEEKEWNTTAKLKKDFFLSFFVKIWLFLQATKKNSIYNMKMIFK